MEESVVMQENSDEKEPRSLKLGRIVLWGAVALVLVFLALGLMQAFQAQPIDGAEAPDFTITTYDGEEFTLSAQRGEVTVINFWASWCVPCMEEAEDLEAAWQTYQDDGVNFVGVGYVDSDAAAREFIERYGITYPNGPDIGTRISDDYNITGVPETFIVNGEGRVVFFYANAMSYEQLVREIEAAKAGS